MTQCQSIENCLRDSMWRRIIPMVVWVAGHIDNNAYRETSHFSTNAKFDSFLTWPYKGLTGIRNFIIPRE